MPITLSKESRKEALASIVRYFHEAREEELGVIAAGGLLDFILQEIGPSIYNRAVADVLKRMDETLADLGLDFNEQEFPYWARHGGRKRQS